MTEQINLYVKPPSVSAPLMVAGAAVALAIVAMTGWAITNEARISSRESNAQETMARVQLLQKQVADQRRVLGLPDFQMQRKEIADLQSKVDSNRELLSQLDKGEIGTRQGHSRIFEAIAMSSEKGLWLTSVDITKSGQNIVLGGRAYNSDVVLRFSRRLNESMERRGLDFRFSGVDMSKGPLVSSAARDQVAVPKIDGIRFTLN